MSLEALHSRQRRQIEQLESEIKRLEAELDKRKRANEIMKGAVEKSIAIADDYADSGISRPIRQALAEIEGMK